MKRSDDEKKVNNLTDKKNEINLTIETTTTTQKPDDEAIEIKRTTESIAFGQRRTSTRKNDIKDKMEKKVTKV